MLYATTAYRQWRCLYAVDATFALLGCRLPLASVPCLHGSPPPRLATARLTASSLACRLAWGELSTVAADSLRPATRRSVPSTLSATALILGHLVQTRVRDGRRREVVGRYSRGHSIRAYPCSAEPVSWIYFARCISDEMGRLLSTPSQQSAGGLSCGGRTDRPCPRSVPCRVCTCGTEID